MLRSGIRCLGNFIIIIGGLLPVTVFAHLISIFATSPFPSIVLPSSISTGTFTIQNLTSRTPLTVIDRSHLPRGLTIVSTTCGRPINPGQTCAITLRLIAPSTPQIVYAKLREWAKPSADGVVFPFSIQVENPASLIIAPTTATIRKNGTQQFTATATFSDSSTVDVTTLVTWQSSDQMVATITSGSGGGLATGVNFGSTAITATFNALTSNTATLTVQAFAYVVNFISNTVVSCPISASGPITGCGSPINTIGTGPTAIIINSANDHVYVLNENTNNIVSCAIANSGIISGCSGAVAVGIQPNNLVLNNANDRIYVVNRGASNSVSTCTLVNGIVTSCAPGVSSGGVSPLDIALNNSNDHAYVVNINSNNVVSCPISGGAITSCSGAITITSLPASIAVNNISTRAYITRSAPDAVSTCTIVGGVISSCAAGVVTGGGFPVDIILNSSNDHAYIINQDNSVSSCAITAGAITSCALVTATGNSPASIGLSPNNNYAYITNLLSHTIANCTISSGLITNCSATVSSAGLNPNAIAVSF